MKMTPYVDAPHLDDGLRGQRGLADAVVAIATHKTMLSHAARTGQNCHALSIGFDTVNQTGGGDAVQELDRGR
ncbi:MAG: hypothetical protein GC182_01965 [Rhodopseudomonas sp.]|nr:hypothetical protein [Rhodopseudomonas sp.]